MSAPLDMMFVLGLPGSGKSTYMERHMAPACPGNMVICFDTLRRGFGHAYHTSTEPMVNALACAMARTAFMSGKNVYVDESITVPGVAMDLVTVGRECNARIHMVHLSAPVPTCRANRVPHVMPATDFERKLAEWQMWGKFILSLADSVEYVDALHRPKMEAVRGQGRN